jgi:uncharacterized protein YkwD
MTDVISGAPRMAMRAAPIWPLTGPRLPCSGAGAGLKSGRWCLIGKTEHSQSAKQDLKVISPMRPIIALAAWLIAMCAISGTPSAASVAITADSLTIGGCPSNRAIGGGAVGMYCAGDIHGRVNFPPSQNGSYEIGIVAQGNSGWGLLVPQARISVDGVAIGTIAVTTSSYSTYTLSNIVTSAGTHVIDIAFANGYTGPFPGFALYIQSIQITPNADVPAPVPSPPTSVDAYQQQLLNLINGSRASAGLPSYTFSAVQSAGTAGCVGSYGHSVHMAQVGQISHDQFPQDICIPWSAAGENVGEASGSESVAIQTLHRLMMSEGPGGGHYQNIMSTTFTTVGIGLYYTGGTLWLTEDFVR